MNPFQIYPAILTDDVNLLRERLTAYLEADFAGIDIDIADKGFLIYDTVDLATALQIISEVTQNNNLPQNYFGLDMAVSNANECLAQIASFSEQNKINLRTYLDAKSDTEAINNLQAQAGSYRGIVLQSNFRVKDLKRFGEFDEVQLMGIKVRQQHEPFWDGVLAKVSELRDSGFDGVISIDGGINLQTATILNEYVAHDYLNRVSVGSYFQDAKDVKLNKQKLELAFAMRTQSELETDAE